MRLKDVSSRFISLSENLELKETKKRNKYLNLETGQHILRIPILGGPLYIIYKLREGLYWRRELTRKYNQSTQIKEELRAKKSLYSSIHNEVEQAISKSKVSVMHVNTDYIGYFVDVLDKDFPNVTALRDDSDKSKFTLVVQEDDQI